MRELETRRPRSGYTPHLHAKCDGGPGAVQRRPDARGVCAARATNCTCFFGGDVKSTSGQFLLFGCWCERLSRCCHSTWSISSRCVFRRSTREGCGCKKLHSDQPPNFPGTCQKGLQRVVSSRLEHVSSQAVLRVAICH